MFKKFLGPEVEDMSKVELLWIRSLSITVHYRFDYLWSGKRTLVSGSLKPGKVHAPSVTRCPLRGTARDLLLLR